MRTDPEERLDGITRAVPHLDDDKKPVGGGRGCVNTQTGSVGVAVPQSNTVQAGAGLWRRDHEWDIQRAVPHSTARIMKPAKSASLEKPTMN